jgi:hypothetical protein
MNIKLIGTVLGLLLFSLPAHARLGWSLKQCQDRYGKDEITHNSVYPEIHVFHVGDIEVHLVFKGIPPADVAVVATYFNKVTKTFGDREIQTMLDKNADGSLWTGPVTYRDQGANTNYTLWNATKHDEWTLRAEYDTTGPNAGVLLIETKAEYFLAQQAEENNGI